MTYEELMLEIKAMTEEQRKCNVMVCVRGVDRWYPAESGVEYTMEYDSLGKDYPFLTI